MYSPEYVKTSLAAAMTLGLKPGTFYRNAKLKALNLLLAYPEGCAANCAYCGLSRSLSQHKTFIRVAWPHYRLDEIIERSLLIADQIQRLCVSMVTHPRALADMCQIIWSLKSKTPFKISALITPTVPADNKSWLKEIKKAGADKAGIAIDAATRHLFDEYRGKGVQGPHKWDVYWDTLAEAVAVFGKKEVGIHLIVGLSESEYEAVSTIQSAHDLGALTHLFSFFPEKGTCLQLQSQPMIGAYRRVQLARYLINHDISSLPLMKFNHDGQIVDFGVTKLQLETLIVGGKAFWTSGCCGPDGTVACNRPYGNERPSQPIRNFPFDLEYSDIIDVKEQLTMY